MQSPAKFSQAIRRSLQSFWLLGKTEADQLFAIARIREEAGAGYGSDADVFHQVTAERHVVGETEARDVGHHIIRALWPEATETGLVQDVHQRVAPLAIFVRKIRVVFGGQHE